MCVECDGTCVNQRDSLYNVYCLLSRLLRHCVRNVALMFTLMFVLVFTLIALVFALMLALMFTLVFILMFSLMFSLIFSLMFTFVVLRVLLLFVGVFFLDSVFLVLFWLVDRRRTDFVVFHAVADGRRRLVDGHFGLFSLATLDERTLEAFRLVDAVVDAISADALATSVVEPAIRRGAHRSTSCFAFVPRHALRHVGDGAVRLAKSDQTM